MIYRMWFLALVASISLASQSMLNPAVQKKEISLGLAVKQALADSLPYQIEKLGITETMEQVRGARFGLLPKAHFYGSYAHEWSKSSAENVQASLNVDIPIFDAGALALTKGLEDKLTMLKGEQSLKEGDRMVQVAQAYSEALIAQAAYAVAAEKKNHFEAEVASFARKVEVGEIRMLDLQRAEYQLQRAITDVTLGEKLFREKLADLGLLIGETDEFLVAPFAVDYAWESLGEQDLWDMCEQNHCLQPAERAVQWAQVNLSSKKLDFLPKLSGRIEAGYLMGLAGTGKLPEPSSRFMIQLNWPLFNGPMWAATFEAKAHYLKESLRLRQETMTLHAKLRGGLAALKALERAKNSSKQALDFAQIYQTSVARLFSSGEALALENLEAELNVFSAKSEYEKDKVMFELEKLRLLHLVGSIKKYFS